MIQLGYARAGHFRSGFQYKNPAQAEEYSILKPGNLVRNTI